MPSFPVPFRAAFVLAALLLPAKSATIVKGDVTAAIGPNFFFDAAVIGDNNNDATDFIREIDGYWAAGATVTLRGLGWASSGSGTFATNATVTFTDAGPDGTFGTADDVAVGGASDNLTYAGASEYVWDFDSDVVFTATGTKLRIRIVSNDIIRRKATGGTAQADVKLSLAGTAVGGGPLPVTYSGQGSGFWDALVWKSGGTTVTGNLPATDFASLGHYRTVTYRGLPAGETVGRIDLGEGGADTGQATLVVRSGTLGISTDLIAGIGAGQNDAFVEARGGTLAIGGSARFGLADPGCDGSLTVAGGAVEIGGDLELGAFEKGGSMLRFHNPGSSPPVAVGGTLALGRCALDLTFDSAYIHTPGTVIPLVTYAVRDGQFGNFRRGQEFNCGPNRFRIDYDVRGGSSGKIIILTALPNWTTRDTPPNIVFILSDDQGYTDLSLNQIPGWKDKFPMPRVDSIAAGGVRFTDAYVTGGVCHPSRCGILSGRYQERFAAENNLGGPNYNGVSVSQQTVPRRLQALGYRTYGVGKWHMGYSVDYHPNVRGFDQWYGIWAGSRSYYNSPGETGVFQDQMTPDFAAENTDYVTDRIGDKTVEFIADHAANHAGQPFYVYMSFTAVHAPMDLKTIDPRYNRLQSEFGLTATDYQNSPIIHAGSNQATVDANRHELAAMTLALDENVGKVIDKVEQLGMTQNTIFVYMTDNGGAGWSAAFGGNYSYNIPLRGYKGEDMTEGSIRVPCAMKWPAKVASSQVISTPVISLDFMATFVNAAGAPAAARNGLDGLDLLPLLKDGMPLPADRALTWRISGNRRGGSAIRMGDWKLLIADAGQQETLYHLPDDPGEANDLAAANPEIVAKLRARFDSWESATVPPFYGPGSIANPDAGLERTAITGGYRLRQPGTALTFLSASIFRTAHPLGQDFHLRFLARSTEAATGPAAQLAWGLCDSTDPAQFVRAVIDFGQSAIRLENGRSGTVASAPLPALPFDFTECALDFDAATNTLSFTVKGATVSLPLTGGYSLLAYFAAGAGGMEGEITTLVPTSGSSLGEGASNVGGFESPKVFGLETAFPGMPPFPPVPERSADLLSFTEDKNALTESLGGGAYRTSFPILPVTGSGFFRLRLDQP